MDFKCYTDTEKDNFHTDIQAPRCSDDSVYIMVIIVNKNGLFVDIVIERQWMSNVSMFKLSFEQIDGMKIY